MICRQRAVCYLRLLQYCEEARLEAVIDIDTLKEKLLLQVKHSIFYADNKDAADYECEYIPNTQSEEGSWNIPWSWTG